MRKTPSILTCALITLATLPTAHAQFKHPGCLSTKADLDRMAAKVAAGEQPWKASWDKLVENTNRFVKDSPGVQSPIQAGGGRGENYIRLARDCAKTYQLALRYHGSGEKKFADKAVEILNAWADKHKEWKGDTNVSLRAGIYGYQFACAAELLRDYPGWRRSDFRNFQRYMLKQFYPKNKDFLTRRHGTVPSHYWANWVHAAQASMMAIGVLCDDRKIFNEAVNYFYNGPGNENIDNAVPILHPNGLGQWQESGRDQGHSLMGPQLLGVVCEIAWNQGVDLYGAKDNRFLAGVEYISKYNLGYDVPWVTYVYVHKHPGKEKRWIQNSISSHGRGMKRPGWDLIYNHYVNRRGLSAPWTQRYAESVRPEGGGFDYGGSSGGFDGLGFTTLTHSRDPIAKGAVPSALRPYVEGRQVTLSWAGSAYAKSYNVKRATAKGGPFTTIATVQAPTQYYIDPGLTAGTTYYYVVSANNPDGESGNSARAAALADGQLHGAVIGTDGSYQNAGAHKFTVFDGSLDSYFDPPGENAWVGLDLGPEVKAVITAVEYCPREHSGGRMVGGKFQGSNTPDFSSDVVDLFTIRKAPEDGVMTSQDIEKETPFRYVRYIAPPDGRCDVAEIQFLGDVSGLDAPAALLGATPAAASPSLPFVFDMVHHNPGEAKFQTRFLDPTRLKAWGFNGNVPREFVQSAIAYDSFDRDIFPIGSKERAWVEDYAREIDALISSMKAEGQPCYPFTDFIVLPKRLVEKYRAEICDAKGRVDVSRPRTKEVLRAMIAGIFERFPDLGGLTVRHGETYLHDVPYHTGGNPILNGEASHIELINLLREEVCVKRNKLIFYRTWDFGNMHDKPGYYLGVTDRVEPHPNLFFSIKHQLGDFHRLSRFNPCLGIGKHRQIVEVQAQLEAYGKGAFPYYNGQGVIDGWEEYAGQTGPKGLRDLLGDPRFAGVWTWSRGGGWKGPHIPNEFWIELNTYVAAKWAQNPARTEEDVFNEFAREIASIRDTADLARFRRLALLSASAVLRSQNSLVQKLDVWWNRDEYFADITRDLRKVYAASKTTAFLAEKAEASTQWREIESLAGQLKLPDARVAEFVLVSSTYGRIKAEIIEQMCRAILFSLEKPAAQKPDPRIATAIARYDELWTEWRQLRADHPDSCATLYTDREFVYTHGAASDRPGMGAAIDRLRKR